MKTKLRTLSIFLCMILFITANAKENKGVVHKQINPSPQVVGCPNTTAQADLNINNVRARILNGGDLWWDPISQVNYYEVPIGSNKNSIYCGALWIGGLDGAGTLKVAAQTYRQQGANDFWAGPISKNPVTIILTQSCVAVDTDAVSLLVPVGTGPNVPAMAAMYLQSLDYDRISSLPTIEVTVDSVPLILKRGIHYFLTANEMVVSPEFTGKSKYPNLPTQL